MKAQHHDSLFSSRAAGPVSIYRPGPNGDLVLIDVKPAGTLETAKLDAKELSSKPGRKPNAAKFAETENDF